MKRMSVVLKWSLKENLKRKELLILLGVMVVTIIPVMLGMSFGFKAILAEGPGEEMQVKLSWIMGMTCYLSAFLAVGIGVIIFISDPVTKEKARGTIESLMATPLKAKNVWLGKSLAAFLPSLILGLVLTFIIVAMLNYLYVMPAIHHFVLPAPAAISSFLLVPFIFLGLTLLVMCIAMMSNPHYALAIAIIVFVAGASVIPQLWSRGTINFLSLDFVLINLGLVILLGVVNFFLARLLTKEKVVLSSKG